MTAFTDTFAGSAGTQLDSDGSSPAWTKDSLSNAANTTVNGANKVQGSAGGGGELAPSTGSADHYAQFSVVNTSMASFVCLRMTNFNNYVGVRITGSKFEIWERSGGTYTGSAAIKSQTFAAAGVTASIGSVIKFMVSGTTYTLSCDGTALPGMTCTSSVNSTTQTCGIHNRFSELIVGQTWTSDAYAPPDAITINETAQKANQTLPQASAALSRTITFSGTYTGTAPTNVDVQLTNASGGAVVVAWTTLSSPSISGGVWSGTLTVSNTATYLLAQARETNNTAVTSSQTTKAFNVGPTILMIGQSLNARFWQNSARLTDVTTTNSSTTVSSATIGTNCGTNVLAGLSWTGTNIPGGTTVVSNSGNNVVLSAAATGSGTNLTNDVGLTPPSASSGTTRYQGDLPYPTSDAKHASELDVNTIANAEGGITLCNYLASGFSGGAMMLAYAVGSTRSKTWISPAGGNYTTTSGSSGLAGIGSDLDVVNWNNGQSDAVALSQSVGGTASGTGGVVRLTLSDTSMWVTGDTATVSGVGGTTEANGTWTITVVDSTHVELQGTTWANAWTSGGTFLCLDASTVTSNTTNIEAWCRGFRSTVAFGITPVGSDNGGGAVDACYDTVRQAQLNYIDTNASGYVFFGGLDLDFKRQDQFHLLPTERVRHAKRVVQAYLRYRGLSSSGYGPKITRVEWNGGTTVTVTVTHEAGTALRSKNLSSSGSSLTGFKVYGNGTLATISSTAFTQPNKIVLTLSSTPASPVKLSYLAGANPTITNPVYDDQAPQSDSDGLPLQPSRGTSGLITAVAGGLPLDVLSFGVAS